MKREPVGDEREHDDWLGITLRHLPAADVKTCLDAETLAAWAEGGLSSHSAAAAEAHAATCSRCTAVLAALGRTAPAAPARPAWGAARVFRWLVPLTAAATAIAIWVVVPDRPITPVSTTVSQDIQLKSDAKGQEQSATNPRADLESNLNQEAIRRAEANRDPDGTPNRSRNRSATPAAEAVAPEDRFQARNELRRAEPSSIGATAGAAAPEAPPPAAAAPSARALSADALTEAVAPEISAQSVAGVDRQIRWRIIAPAAIERSTDGGRTWSRTMSPARTATAVRAVNADRAVVTSADGAVFYTTDGGASWTRVQENSAAPF